MKDQIRCLVDLQATDDGIAALREQLAAIPRQIDSFRAGYLRAQQGLEALKGDLEAAGRERRSAERELETHEGKIRKLKDQEVMVKTNQQYQTLLHEIKTEEEAKGAFEEKVLLMMDKASEAERDIKLQEAVVVREKEHFAAEEARLKGEQALLEARLAEAEERRAGIVQGLGAELLRTYGRLREFHGGRAVAPVVEGVCQGCWVALRPQRLQEIKASLDVLICEQCKRIIYVPEDKGGDVPPAPVEG